MRSVLQAIRTVDSRQTGGPEEMLLMLGPYLRRNGRFATPILLLRKPNPAADPALDFGNRARSAGLRVVPLQDMRWTPGWLGRLPRRLRVEAIHVHGQRANYFIWIMRRLFPRTWGRLPLIATVHGWVQDNFVRKVVTWLEFGTLRECDFVITVSSLQRLTLLERGFDPARVRVVRPGIPFLERRERGRATPAERAAARARWGLPEEAFVISAVGRLSTEKRHDLYLQVCSKLSEQMPDARFMLVGGGKQEANLHALASELGLQERLIFTGLTREMDMVYAATDLLMLTSDTEGTPHVLLEAMGSGIPIVSTAVGGIPEFVTSEQQGILVPAGDREALVKAVVRLHRDPELMEHIRIGGAELASEFTIERMAQEIEDIYSLVLKHREVENAHTSHK